MWRQRGSSPTMLSFKRTSAPLGRSRVGRFTRAGSGLILFVLFLVFLLFLWLVGLLLMRSNNLYFKVSGAVVAAAALAPLRSLVVCAGYGDHQRTIGRDGRYESAYDLDRFRAVVETNLVGAFNCVRLAATVMSRNLADADGQRGAIVLTSSVSAYDGQIGQAAYAASKAALHGLVLPVARDLAPAGIRVNVLVPGAFDTPIYGPDGVGEALRKRLNEAIVFPKRMGHAEEFAAAALMLLTNDYVNASILRIDAGLRTLPR